MAKIGLPKVSGKRLKVWEKSVKIQGILKWILSGNPGTGSSESTLVKMPHCWESYVTAHLLAIEQKHEKKVLLAYM